MPPGAAFESREDSTMEAVAVEASYIFKPYEENYGEASEATAKGRFW